MNNIVEKILKAKDKETIARQYKDILKFDDWIQIFIHYSFSIDFIREISFIINKFLLWGTISKNKKFSEKEIEEFKEILIWSKISLYQDLSKDFIRKWSDKLDWNWIVLTKDLDNDLLEEFHHLIDNEVFKQLKQMNSINNNKQNITK